MKYLTLLALPLLAAASQPAMYADAECVHNGLSDAARAAVTLGLTQSDPPLTKVQEDRNTDALAAAALTCASGRPWTEERQAAAMELAMALMLYNKALPGLKEGAIDPANITGWFRKQTKAVQTGLFTDAVSEADTEKLVANLFAELEVKGNDISLISERAEDIGYLLSALTIRVRTEAASSPK
jgi:hypothetical protein